MKKTSLTHPLRIAVIAAGPEFGPVGITFCPGKYDRQAMSGEWDRDLALDLDAVRDWGAAAVVTLLANFSAGSDGHGGSMITDPPSAASVLGPTTSMTVAHS
jgi:hypothetical protein